MSDIIPTKLSCEKESTVRLFFVFFIPSTVFLFLVFSPVLFIPFAHHNDANLWRYDQENSKYYGHENLVKLGRFVQAHLVSFHFSLLDDELGDLAVSRAVAIAAAAALLAWFSVILHRVGLRKFFAFCLSVWVFTLPGMQLYILWVGNFCPGILTTGFALLSAGFAERLEKPFLPTRQAKKNLWYFGLSLVFFLIALYTYPPAAMFYLGPTLALVLFGNSDDWKTIRLRVFGNLIIFCTGIFLYFVTHRFIAPLIDPSIAAPQTLTNYRFSLTGDFINKAWWFLKEHSNICFSLWNIYTNTYLSVAVVLVIIAGFIPAICRPLGSGKTSKKYVFELLAVVFGLVILSNTPILAAEGSFTVFRMSFVYSAMIAIVVGRSVLGITCILPESLRQRAAEIILFTVMILAGFSAQYNSTTTALNANIELNFIRNQIMQQTDPNDTEVSVFVHMLDDDRSFLDLKIFPTEFNSCATNRIFVRGIVDVALSQLDLEPITIMGIGSDDSDKVYGRAPGSVVINMNDLKRDSFERNKKLVESFTYVVDSSNGPAFGISKAFDGNPGTFWETSEPRTGKPFPHWIEMDFGEHPKTIKTYALLSGPAQHGIDGSDASGRMPKDWQFQGSNDGKEWTVLDIQKAQTQWQPGEKRAFSCSFPESFRYYRLYVTAGVAPRILRLYELTFQARPGR
ncbi:MAG: discoidin domain-containing protein [Planctomycetota bacterium]|jgi:hypothetical protein